LVAVLYSLGDQNGSIPNRINLMAPDVAYGFVAAAMQAGTAAMSLCDKPRFVA
jgi:hypothetical protein